MSGLTVGKGLTLPRALPSPSRMMAAEQSRIEQNHKLGVQAGPLILWILEQEYEWGPAYIISEHSKIVNLTSKMLYKIRATLQP